MTRVALLVVDVQNDFVHPDGKAGQAHGDVEPLLAAVDAINGLIRVARAAAAPVVYVQVTHSPVVDNPAYRARYAARGMSPDDLLCADGSWGAELYEGLESPLADDLTVTKHAYDAFAGGGLSEQLTSLGVDTIMVTGVVTELCVQGTVSGGFERGFHVIVPREATGSVDPDAAAAALALVTKYYGTVATVEECAGILGAGQHAAADVP